MARDDTNDYCQEEAGLPKSNPFYGNRDVSLITDVPYLDWSSIFKPQNIGFFILPLETAFALKWWLLGFLLLISSYYFILKILPGKYWLAIGGSVIIGCSPFVFWWYQTITIAPMFYAFFILIVGMNIIDKKPLILFRKHIGVRLTYIFRTLCLSYLLIAFCFVLYPPFQIPVALVVAFFLLGYFLNRYPTLRNYKLFAAPLIVFMVSFLLLTSVCATFIYTRQTAFDAISSTAYPAKRVVEAGGFSVTRSLTTYLQLQLEDSETGSRYIDNQSESSSFIVLPFFFIVPATGFLVWLYIKKRRIEWVLLFILACICLMLAHLFLPFASPLTKLFFLYLVPQPRLIIGLGIAALVLLVYLVKLFYDEHPAVSRNYRVSVIFYSVLFFLLSVKAGLSVSRQYPLFVSNKLLIVGLAMLLVGSFACFLLRKPSIGMIGLVVLTLTSSIFIHPLYRGMSTLTNNDVVRTIKTISTKNDVWASDTLYFENFPQISERKSIGGVAFYPNKSFWKEYSASSDDSIYNRYAHILVNFDQTQPLKLAGTDSFVASVRCDQKLTKQIDYILSTQKVAEPCLSLVKALYYPKVTVYFYKVLE